MECKRERRRRRRKGRGRSETVSERRMTAAREFPGRQRSQSATEAVIRSEAGGVDEEAGGCG